MSTPSADAIRVLHVDDDPDFAGLATTFLEREDDAFAVETASSADEGLDRLAEGAFDCVVSDYDMPGMDGIEFLRRVREDYPDLPFVLFTGKGSEEVASDAVSAGVTDYLQKETSTDQFTVLANRITNAVEHYRSRRKVERSQRRLREIVDAIPHLLYVTDSEGTYLLANEALAEFHGTTVGEIEGSNVADLLDESGVERFLADVESVLDSGSTVRVAATEVTDADGETHVFEPRLLPYDLAESDDEAVLGIATDVTERERRERRLNALVERLEALHEATRDLVRADDPEAVARLVADAVGEIFEYPSTVVRLREDDRLYPAVVTRTASDELGDRPDYRVDEGIPGEVFQSGEPTVVDDFRDRDDGFDRSPHRSALYLPMGDHGTVSIGDTEVGAFDQSDRSLASVLANNAAAALDRLEGERELQRRNERLAEEIERRNVVESRYRSLFEQFPEPTLAYVYEDDGPHIVRINEAFTDVFGYTDEEAVGEHINDLIVPPDRRERARRLDDRVKAGDSLDEVVRRRTREGVRDFRFRSIRLPDDEEIDGYGVYADISDLKRRERELERQNERLEEFAGMVSHDLRNPLNVVEGRIDLAREECDSQHLEAATAAIRRSQGRVEDLLTLSREGEELDAVETVDLREVTERAWSSVPTGAATLAVETDRRIHADPGRFQQLLENLLRNAVEHGSTSPRSHAPEDAVEHGSTSPDSQARQDAGRASSSEPSVADAPEDAVERDGADVHVTVGGLDSGFYVEDDGPGIPDSEADEVFRTGYSSAGGTGFGLGIVERIVDAHDWSIHVTRGDEGGARFEITGVRVEEG